MKDQKTFRDVRYAPKADMYTMLMFELRGWRRRIFFRRREDGLAMRTGNDVAAGLCVSRSLGERMLVFWIGLSYFVVRGVRTTWDSMSLFQEVE